MDVENAVHPLWNIATKLKVVAHRLPPHISWVSNQLASPLQERTRSEPTKGRQKMKWRESLTELLRTSIIVGVIMYFRLCLWLTSNLISCCFSFTRFMDLAGHEKYLKTTWVPVGIFVFVSIHDWSRYVLLNIFFLSRLTYARIGFTGLAREWLITV